jgi:hypothetical protein
MERASERERENSRFIVHFIEYVYGVLLREREIAKFIQFFARLPVLRVTHTCNFNSKPDLQHFLGAK